MQGILRLVEKLLAAQEGPRSTKLVSPSHSTVILSNSLLSRRGKSKSNVAISSHDFIVR
jgi:hypothetical protein